ncbi:transporter [Corynebacterium yudongzhengii]|uniref:Transporter n=1 Tax=Corynebacterium yudongzhengii TaxID=2080740 RepID=A0A2U1T9D5_9CORY|nr:transporter [Corynebacterium yudongzhengii]AWB82126.1 transporter [Corynebacterium yudongzhengii]PWC02630.1 transporter [Corynebacterium yudongzhengii]
MEFSYEIGIAAGISFVVALALLNFRVVTAESPIYQCLNLFGALGFTYTAISPFNPGLFITETVWALVAVFGLWKIFTGRSKKNADKPRVA